MKEQAARLLVSPYRFFVVAVVLAALFSMLPTQADAPKPEEIAAVDKRNLEGADQPRGVPAGADLSERTQAEAFLHSTLHYLCGHSVQRREALPTQLVGLSQAALSKQLETVVPGGLVTGFCAQEVDIAINKEIPCPLHWMLKLGEQGKLEVLQNVTGEALRVVRETDIEQKQLSETVLSELISGVTFDDVQALEGYMESLAS